MGHSIFILSLKSSAVEPQCSLLSKIIYREICHHDQQPTILSSFSSILYVQFMGSSVIISPIWEFKKLLEKFLYWGLKIPIIWETARTGKIFLVSKECYIYIIYCLPAMLGSIVESLDLYIPWKWGVKSHNLGCLQKSFF